MIQNYNDPRVILKQVYKSAVVGQSPLLGACIIGPHYLVHKYLKLGLALRLLSDYTGTAISMAIPNSELLEIDAASVKVYAPEAKVVILTATYQAEQAQNSNRIAVVFKKAKVGDTVAISDETYQILFIGSDSTGSTYITLDSKVSLSKGTELKLVRVASGYFDVGCVSYVGGSVNIILNATIDGCTVKSAEIYVLYRTLSKEFNNKYGVIAGLDYVLDVLGLVCALNPLGIAVAAAAANAGSKFVYFVSVPADADADAYVKAADILGMVDGCYGIVPCTSDSSILGSLLNYAKQQSALLIPHFKYLYGSADLYDQNLKPLDVRTIVDNKAYSDKRGAIIVADHPKYRGLLVPNYVVAAAIAGLRSDKLAQAPLSNVELVNITTADDGGFTYSDSMYLGANGFWRVGTSAYGSCISRRQLTSAATGDVNYDLQSIVCVVDAVCLTLKQAGRDYVGNSNISPALLALLRADLTMILDSFTVLKDLRIGPMLLDCTLNLLQQDPVDKSRIYTKISGEPPKPFNLFSITFYMN